MAEAHDFTSTAGSHPRAPEGMPPSSVNDGMRAMEGMIQRWYFDTNYSVVGTVSGTVIQLTANRVSLTLTSTTSNYLADLLMAFTMGSSNQPVPVSINVNGIGAISLRDAQGISISSTVMLAGQRCLIAKDATNDYFRLLRPNFPPPRGTATNNDAAAGYIGEYISTDVSSPVALTTATAKTVGSIALTAGDWDVSATVVLTGNAATTVTYLHGSVSLVDNTIDTSLGRGSDIGYAAAATVFANNNNSVSVPAIRISIAVPTTVYMVAKAAFAVNSCSAFGNIHARRVR